MDPHGEVVDHPERHPRGARLALHLGELLLEQLFSARPMLGAGYRTPVRDLWLCGSSAHPGGAISGAPGRNAAAALLRARRGRASASDA